MFSLDRVMPFFFLILLGYALKKMKILPEAFLNGANKFVFRVALPCNLFYNAATVDLSGEDHPRFLLFALLLTLCSFLVIWVVTELLFRDKRLVGTLVQGSFRGNFSLLGVPLATAVVGASAAAPAAMAIALVVPAYSILATTVLAARGIERSRPSVKKVAVGVISTPLFVGAILGMLVSAMRIPIPGMIMQTVSYLSGTATPLGLMAIGGMFNLAAATARLKPALYSSLIKIVLQPLVLVPVCYLLGFRGETLFLYFVLFGAPVAVSSYSVATELGGDGPLASNILIVTTFFSSITLSLGIYVMKAMGWI